MSKLVLVLKEEIRRLARQEIRRANKGIRKDNARLKRDNASLKRRVKKLEQDNEFLVSAERRRAQTIQPVSPDEAKKLRIKGKTIVALRRKLGISQAEFGRLLQVSTVTVGLWERKPGMLRLKPKALAGLAKVKEMGARDAKRLLAELPAKAKKETKKRPAKRAKKSAKRPVKRANKLAARTKKGKKA